jgi:ABC-type phosphate transport system substrate-binding protein
MLLRFKLRKADEGKFRATVFLDEKELAEGYLTASIDELKSSFHQWQEAYLSLDDVALRLTPQPAPPKRYFSRDEIATFAESFRLNFDRWLRGEGDAKWQKAREKLATKLANRSENEIRIFLDFDEGDLRRFPWQDWEFLQEHCQDAEVALCELMDSTKLLSPSDSVKVLVVVGNNKDIAQGVEEDLEAIKELEQQNKGVFKVLKQPSRHELLEELWKQSYEIFIFTGHSGSSDSKEIGWIELNETDSLRLSDLKLALRQAINKRLQLCIFNSCDGLGLAKQLAELKLPLAIVMREPVPDNVAARFLRVFLQNYSNGKSFFKSFREARHQLEGFNAQYPGVCWLPTVCIGRSVEPPTWQQLGGSESLSPDPPIPVTPPPIWKRLLSPKVLVLTLLLLVIGGYLWQESQKDRDPSNTANHEITTDTKIKDIKPPQLSGTMRYGGSTSAVSLNNKILPAILQAFPNLKYKDRSSNTGEGLNKLVAKELDFILASELVGRAGITKSEHIAYDAVAVVVNPNLPITSLTLNDLSRIVGAEVSDWQQITGGKSIPLKVYFRRESGTEKFLKDKLPLTREQADKAFKDKRLFFPLEGDNSPLTQAKNKIPNDLGGIYFVTASQSVNQCDFKPVPIVNSQKQAIAPYEGQLTPRDSNCAQIPQGQRNKVNITAIKDRTYPLIREIYLILRTDDPAAKEWGEYYLKVLRTKEGKDLTQKAGFLPK